MFVSDSFQILSVGSPPPWIQRMIAAKSGYPFLSKMELPTTTTTTTEPPPPLILYTFIIQPPPKSPSPPSEPPQTHPKPTHLSKGRHHHHKG